MASLFNVNRPAIVKHINNILNDGELDDSTCSILEQVQQDGNRNIKRKIHYYNFDEEIWIIHLKWFKSTLFAFCVVRFNKILYYNICVKFKGGN